MNLKTPRRNLLINLDAKILEWTCAVYLSKDKVGYGELLQGTDAHAENQARFKLPDRLTAKTFLYRLIFGGSAYAYAHDPDFTHVSTSEKYWETIVERAYDKYGGLARWHSSLVQEVSKTGTLKVCTGRQYKFFRERGELPRPKILNYPVQGLGHDLMAVIRVSCMKRLKKAGMKSLLVSTVHDSVLFDCPKDETSKICELIFEVFDDAPRQFERIFGVPFDLPLRTEVLVGPDWGNLTEVTKEQLNADSRN